MLRRLILAVLLALALVPAEARIHAPYRGHRIAPADLITALTPGVDFNFASGSYSQAGAPACVSAATCLTTTRASAGYADDAAGNWTSFGNNIPRVTNKGLLVEEGRTNGLRNNSTTGAVAGSPGTLPTNWAISAPTGLARTLTLGTTGGVEWIEINYAGTASSTAPIIVSTETTTTVVAVNGQVWTQSLWFSNSLRTGVSAMRTELTTRDAGGVLLSTFQDITGLADAVWARFAGTSTIVDATTAFVQPRVVTASITNGTVVNLTFRVGWPQLELGAFITSPIRTTAAAAARAADTVISTVYPAGLSGTGTLYASFIVPWPSAANTGNAGIFSFDDGGSANTGTIRIGAFQYTAGHAVFSAAVNVGGAATANSMTQNAQQKAAAAFTPTTSAIALNAGTVATGAVTAVPVSPNRLLIGASTRSVPLSGYVSRIAVWPTTALSNANLQAITQ